MARQGEMFEKLVQWVSETLHEGAEVLPNARLPDRDSGQLREIDILIRIPNGPMAVVVIGEVRDRKGRQGSPWIEQVAEKRRSVGADAAFVVSRNGLSKPALAKARAHGIRVMSFEEARQEDWGQALNATTIRVSEPVVALGVFVIEAGSDRLVSLPPERAAALEALADERVMVQDFGKTPDALARLTAAAVQAVGTARRDEGRPGSSAIDERALVQVQPPLEIVDATGATRLVDRVAVDMKLSYEERLVPLILMRYIDGDGEDAAHVLQSDFTFAGGRFRLSMLLGPRAPHVREGDRLTARMEPLDERARALKYRLEAEAVYYPLETDPGSELKVGVDLRMVMAP